MESQALSPATSENWYESREEAEGVVAEIVGEEPAFEGKLWVEPMSFEYRPN
jgi:hypothetical protein